MNYMVSYIELLSSPVIVTVRASFSLGKHAKARAAGGQMSFAPNVAGQK